MIDQVTSIKSELNGLGDGLEEFRAVCRQLQSQMKMIPDCADAPFESEADTLMDRWLDVCFPVFNYTICSVICNTACVTINLLQLFLLQVTEKTDCHLENLGAGFSLWEKLLLLAGEVEGWSAQKMKSLAQTHPFQTEQDVSAMQVKTDLNV